MSRIGKMAIPVPDGVTLNHADGELQVKGPKGSLSTRLPNRIGFELGDGEVRLTRPDDKQESRALHGLARALAANMVKGVTEGFAKALEIQGVGYRANTSGSSLNLSLGFSHPVEMAIPKGLSIRVEANRVIRIEGMDKQLVGQFAADVRAIRPPEPYKGKGVRYVGEHVRRKVGKTGAV